MKRIFIVEDHPLVRESYAAYIGCEMDLDVCGAAASFAEARQAIPEAHPDLVLVDVSLGAGSPDGIELMQLLKSNVAASWLVVSAHDDLRTVERALGAGARGFLFKREASRMLLQAIRAVLDGGRYVTDR